MATVEIDLTVKNYRESVASRLFTPLIEKGYMTTYCGLQPDARAFNQIYFYHGFSANPG